jgi:hypothetical protein
LGCTINSSTGCGAVGSANVTVQAPVLGGWDVSGNTGDTALAPHSSAANLTVGNLTAGSGVNAGTAANGWGGSGWNSNSESTAISGNKFAAFTIKANPGNKVNFNSISKFFYKTSGTGPAAGALQYSLDGSTFTDITNTIVYGLNVSSSVGAIDLSSIAALQGVLASTTVTFRIVNWNASGSGGTWYINNGNSSGNDLEVAGYVIPISSISGVTASQSISHGTANITLSGTVSAGAVYPADGETVGVTINGVTQNAIISGGVGGFSINFPTATIPFSSTPYTITYAYAGDANLAAANNASTTLTITGITVPNLTYTNAPGIARIIPVSEIVSAGVVSSQTNPTYHVTAGAAQNGGVVITNAGGTLIKYTNSTAFAFPSDSFSYTLTDGLSSGTGTITINFTSVAGPTLNPDGTSGTDGNGHPQLSFHGLPNYTYHIQRSADMITWTTFDAVTCNGTGVGAWTDMNTPIPNPVFYRLSYP